MKFSYVASVLLGLSGTHLAHASGPRLNSFTTDRCTLFLDGTYSHPALWRHCCIIHDLDYWIGGEKTLRLEADAWLGACVNASLGKEWDYGFGLLMNFGTDLGGVRKFPTWWRWGYGWRNLKKLNAKLVRREDSQVTEKLRWAEAWLSTESFARDYGLDPSQQRAILQAVLFKQTHPESSAFQGPPP